MAGLGRQRRLAPRRWIASVLAGVVLSLGPVAGLASAGEASAAPNPPSERGVEPQIVDTGNAGPRNECRTLTGLDVARAFQVAGEDNGFPSGSPYDDGTITVEIANWDAAAKSFDWSSDLPLLGVWVKGGTGGVGNWYDYASFTDQPPVAGADHDAVVHTPPNPNGPAGLSHVTFCYASSDDPGMPDLKIEKTSDADGVLRAGDRFAYLLTISNVGEATAHGVAVTDELPTGLRVLTLVPDFDGGPCTVTSSVGPGGRFAMSVTCRRTALGAGEAATISFKVEVTDDARCGDAKNVATVTGDDEPRGNVDGHNTATHVDEIACPPSIVLDASGPALAHEGDEIVYRFVVTNDGKADLRDVTLRNPDCDTPLARTDHGDGDGVLAPNESWSFRCARTITGGDGDPVRNTARVSATDGDDEVSDTASHEIDVLHPAIDILKTVNPASGQVGETITYSFEVTNTGDAPLSDIVVTDDVMGSIGTVAQLAPGHRAVLKADYVLPAAGISVVNVGTATGVDGLGLEVSDTDDVSISIVAPTGGPDGDGTTVGGTAFTGVDTTRPTAAAIVLMALGLGLLFATRRRSPDDSTTSPGW